MGTGINRMIDAMEIAGLEKPIFQTEGYFFKVIFKRSQFDANTKLAIESDRLAIDSDRLAIEGADKISIILEYLKKNKVGRSSDFTDLLKVSPQRIRQILQPMIQKDLIVKHGEKRHTYYTISENDQNSDSEPKNR